MTECASFLRISYICAELVSDVSFFKLSSLSMLFLLLLDQTRFVVKVVNKAKKAEYLVLNKNPSGWKTHWARTHIASQVDIRFVLCWSWIPFRKCTLHSTLYTSQKLYQIHEHSNEQGKMMMRSRNRYNGKWETEKGSKNKYIFRIFYICVLHWANVCVYTI